MVESTRVVFTFDERSLDILKRMTENGRFRSMAETVRAALGITQVLQTQQAQGFTEVVVRNPETQQQRTIVIPALQAFAPKSASLAL